MSRQTEYCEQDFEDEYESETDVKIKLMRLSSVKDRESAINQIGRNKVNKWARSDSSLANLIANDKVALETIITTISAGQPPPRLLSESSRSIMESSAALSDQLRFKRAAPPLPKRALTEGERVDEAIRRRATERVRVYKR